MEKFTKGPWLSNGRLVYSSDAVFIATASKTDIEDFQQIEANAALIAAAPEMYEMLKNICTSLNYLEHCELIDEVWGLLSKARGEQ